jgi:hypothetical protein
MNFLSTISTADKTTTLNTIIADKEQNLYALSWAVGIDPDDLAADYTAPVGTENPSETQLEAELAAVAALKAKLASL